MSLLNIQNPEPQVPFSVFVLGFRPFFIAAGLFSVISMFLWWLVYSMGLSIPLQGLSLYHWHAHEMIYGFGMAVVAGFLLTAVRNWTGVHTLQYKPLMLLVMLWLSARLCLLLGTQWIQLAAVFDLLFNLGLFAGVIHPVLRVRQWKQMGIMSKVLLLAVFNSLFYLGVLGVLELGVYWGVYGGLFLLLALILTMGRRVMPSFIENGVGYPVKLKNSRLLDISSLLLFLTLSISETFMLDKQLSSVCGGILFLVSLFRLYNWYTPGTWRAPLLWGLYLAFAFFTLGFLLFALIPYIDLVYRSLALHAFAVGGIGLITVSMMSRVTLGHTGRDVRQPSKWIAVAQILLVLGGIVRVLLPILAPELYPAWIIISQGLWIAAFTLFMWANVINLIRPRIDGAVG